MTYELRRFIQGEDKNSDLYWEQDFYHPNGNIVYDCQGYSIKGSGNVLFFISPEVEVRSRSTSELETTFSIFQKCFDTKFVSKI